MDFACAAGRSSGYRSGGGQHGFEAYVDEDSGGYGSLLYGTALLLSRLGAGDRARGGHLCEAHVDGKLTFAIDFWGPVSNFGIPLAAIMDTQKSPEL